MTLRDMRIISAKACKTRVTQLNSDSLQLVVSISTETVQEKCSYDHNQLGVTVTVESKQLFQNQKSFSDAACQFKINQAMTIAGTILTSRSDDSDWKRRGRLAIRLKARGLALADPTCQ